MVLWKNLSWIFTTNQGFYITLCHILSYQTTPLSHQTFWPRWAADVGQQKSPSSWSLGQSAQNNTPQRRCTTPLIGPTSSRPLQKNEEPSSQGQMENHGFGHKHHAWLEAWYLFIYKDKMRLSDTGYAMGSQHCNYRKNTLGRAHASSIW